MRKIVLKPLKSKKQLRTISFKEVTSAGFTDENEEFFTICFDVENGEKQDLTIVFETRSPKLFLSGKYKD